MRMIDDISLYMDKSEVGKKDNAETAEAIDDLVKPKESPKAKTSSPDGSTTTEFGRFTAVADLKPGYLDNEANLIEINQWIEQFQNYVRMGYHKHPPATGVSMHLDPLLHYSWLQSLENKDIKNKDWMN